MYAWKLNELIGQILSSHAVSLIHACKEGIYWRWWVLPPRFQWFLGDFYNSSWHLYLFCLYLYIKHYILYICFCLCIRVYPESASWLAIYLRVFVFVVVCPASWLAKNLRAASQLLPQSRRSCHHYTKHYNITPSTQSAHTWPLKLTLWNKV